MKLCSSWGKLVTPLTDRCVLTLLTALQFHRIGNPLGPSGTGKTETVKDLAKNLAKYCVVSNCSEGMDYKSVGNLLSGISQCGCWGCFDEFNRMKIDVMSVVALQVTSIFDAQKANKEYFEFMGANIKCSLDTGIFITFNPGYAARQELPENLKALTRPVSMMSPNLNLIAEVVLAAEGFASSRSLAKKLTSLYELMQYQLSKQKHYDFGLRSIKLVLNVAGTLKRGDRDSCEELILVEALCNINLPKFLKGDAQIFHELLLEVFQKVSPIVNNSLQKVVENELMLSNLHVNHKIVEKVLQLDKSQQMRHCNMLVGPTLGGKTTIWKTLSSAKIKLKELNSECLKIFIINPIALTIPELYGCYDLSNFEWTEGVLSKLFKACSASNNGLKWIIFDGPVDALWIESMNSVMDDNKLLTLANGDRIPMNSSTSLLFEVEDLIVASVSGISRLIILFRIEQN